MVCQSKSRKASPFIQSSTQSGSLAINVRYDNIDFPNERSQRQFRTYLAFRAIRQLLINTGIKQLRYVTFQNHEALLSVEIYRIAENYSLFETTLRIAFVTYLACNRFVCRGKILRVKRYALQKKRVNEIGEFHLVADNACANRIRRYVFAKRDGPSLAKSQIYR